MLGFRIGHAHHDPAREDVFPAASRLMLESALGELAFAECVRHVEVVALPSSPQAGGFRPLVELAALIGHDRD